MTDTVIVACCAIVVSCCALVVLTLAAIAEIALYKDRKRKHR